MSRYKNATHKQCLGLVVGSTGIKQLFYSNVGVCRVSLLALMLITFLAALSEQVFAQTPPSTMTVTGAISLDRGVAAKNYSLLLKIQRHTIVVLPNLGILFPIVDTKSTTTTMLKGQSTTQYSVAGISTDGTYFSSVRIDCANCDKVIGTQYRGPSGTFTGFSQQVLFNRPVELPEVLDISLLTNNTVTGQVSLPDGMLATRDLKIEVRLLSADGLAITGQRAVFTIQSGNSSATYSINKVSRFGIGIVKAYMNCSNCSPDFKGGKVFPNSLNTANNLSNIDFIIELNEVMIPPILLLLLEEESDN